MYDLESIIDFRDDGHRMFVRFPAPELLEDERTGASCPSAVLLRASGGRIVAAGANAFAWTDARVDVLDEVVSDVSLKSDAERRSALNGRLHLTGRALWVPPSLDPDDVWDLRWAARTIQRTRSRCGGSGFSAAFDAAALGVEREVRLLLSQAADRFMQALDPVRARESAVRGRFDPRVYNWLLPGPTRRNREQLAKTFPFLLPFIATPTAEAAAIRAVVDDGHPTAATLARRWGVRPGTIRALRGQPSEWIGPAWSDSPEALTMVLDAIPADRRPTSPRAWDELNRTVAAVVRAGVALPAESPPALAWIRERLARSSRRGLRIEDAPELRDMRFADAAVAGLRDGLIHWLETEVPRERFAEPPDRVALKRAADRFLVAQPYGRQVGLAWRFWRCIESQVGHGLAAEIAFQLGESGWPLLPEDRICADGRRRVHAVTTRQELRQYGLTFANCLRTALFGDYARDMATGESFFLVVLDAVTSEALSLADLRVKLAARRAESVEVVIKEHKPPGNCGLPTAPCRAAIEEVAAWLRSSADALAHLQRGRAKLRAREAVRDDLLRDAGLGPVVDAVRATLGTKGLTKLVACVDQLLRPARPVALDWPQARLPLD